MQRGSNYYKNCKFFHTICSPHNLLNDLKAILLTSWEILFFAKLLFFKWTVFDGLLLKRSVLTLKLAENSSARQLQLLIRVLAEMAVNFFSFGNKAIVSFQ